MKPGLFDLMDPGRSITEEEFFRNRLEPQIRLYDRSSRRAGAWFWFLQGTQILAASSIPLLAGGLSRSLDPTATAWAIGLLGALIAVCGAFSTLFQLQKQWIQFRATCEVMKNEAYLFLGRCAPYDSHGALQLLIARVEAFDSSATNSWATVLGRIADK